MTSTGFLGVPITRNGKTTFRVYIRVSTPICLWREIAMKRDSSDSSTVATFDDVRITPNKPDWPHGEDRDCRDEHRPREPRFWVHECRFLVLVTFFGFASPFRSLVSCPTPTRASPSHGTRPSEHSIGASLTRVSLGRDSHEVATREHSHAPATNRGRFYTSEQPRNFRRDVRHGIPARDGDRGDGGDGGGAARHSQAH